MLPRWMPVWLCVAAVGCTANMYEIKMTPDGSEFERSVRVWQAQTQGAARQQQLERFATAYDQAIPTPDQQWSTFQGKFRGQPPQDVGGRGLYIHYASPCGSVTAYLERFRGSDDVVTELDARRKAVDKVVEYLSGWFQSEVGDDPEFVKLQTFLNTDFRHDFANVSTYLHFAEFNSQTAEPRQFELPVRMVQYLMERDYLRSDELPRWNRVMTTDDQRGFVSLLQRTFARKLGIADTAPISPILNGMSDWNVAEKSLRDYMRQQPEFTTYQKAQRQQNQEEEIDPLEVLQNQVERALYPQGLLRSHDRLAIELALSHPPQLTNGTWDDTAQTVKWKFDLETADTAAPHEFPRFSYAAWTQPATDYQVAHFGTVLLDNEYLTQYCLWYASLSADEAREWDGFLDTLKPGPEFTKHLRGFRFSEEQAQPNGDDGTKPLAQHVVSLILQRHQAAQAVRTFDAN